MARFRRARRKHWVGEMLEARCVLDSTVVFNEVMFHPSDRDSVGEWIEFHNQMSTPIEVSRWTIAGGVDFQFPNDLLVAPGDYIVVASAPNKLAGVVDPSHLFGPWTGNLSNGGERLELRNHTGRLMSELNYDDVEPWPIGADGSGASLAKRDPQLGTDDPKSWTTSEQFGGTPGKNNFDAAPSARAAIEFSEISAAGPAGWFELLNTTDANQSLTGYRIESSRGAQYTIANQTLAPHGRLSVNLATAGIAVEEGDRLFLWSPDPPRLLDTAIYDGFARARDDVWGGRWQVVEQSTPGSENVFSRHDEIVINEIMYHHRPQYEIAGEPQATTLVQWTDSWRYDATGVDRGTQWSSLGFDDTAWATGGGTFYATNANLGAPKTTPLPTGRSTIYFRKSFELGARIDDLDVSLTHLVDDGAVFYINGKEFSRTNLPNDTITYATLASTTVGDAAAVSGLTIPREYLRVGTNVLAVEVHQSSVASPDVVFGAQLDLVDRSAGSQPYVESNEEWIELYNRSNHAVNISDWQIADAVSFTMPAGTVMQPGDRIVVASDAVELARKFPDIRIVGSFDGTLSNDSETIQLLDVVGNLADEVEYFDGGYWPESADGGGSSLELIDPFADNNHASAWRASDETARSTWQHVSYTRTIAPIKLDPQIVFHELVMGLLDTGEVLVDNLRVVEDPKGAAVSLMQNETFEDDTPLSPPAKWRVMGTHGESEVIVDPDNPDNQVFRVTASGRMNYLSNHVESTLANGAKVVNGRTYSISYDAKWISGSPQLHTELYYKDASRTTILQQPELSGTPGKANSHAVVNVGPSVTSLRHSPVVPLPTDSVEITARAADPDGVAQMTLLYSVNGRDPLVRVPMAMGNDGVYKASIPPQVRNTVVQFYVETLDGRGAVSLYPPAGPESHALYKVRDNFAPSTTRHDFFIVMLPDDVTRLHAPVNMIDNNHLGTTIIYDGKDVYYDAGTRLRGSMFTRQDRSSTGYNISFRPEQRFRGIHDSIGFDQNGETEALIKFVATQAGNLGGTYNDSFQLTSPSGAGGGPTMTYLARHSEMFIEEQFEDGAEGTLFKFEGIRVLTNTTDGKPDSYKLYQPIGWVGNFDITDLGDDKELYRWPFLINGSRDRDDYSRIIDLAKAFSLSGDALEKAVAEVIDVDNWMQTFALMSLFGVGDAYSQGNPHNLNMYVRPTDNKVLALPWDWDFVFSQVPTAPLIGDSNIGKVIRLPHYSHMFYGQMDHLISTVFNRAYLTPRAEPLGRALQQGLVGLINSVEARTDHVLSQLPGRVPFLAGADESSIELRPVLGERAAVAALVPTEANGGSQLGTTWTGVDFAESADWFRGETGVGFEATPANFAPLIHLDASAMLNQNSSLFMRMPFTIDDPSQLVQLKLTMQFDDGFVAYLNGEMVAKFNAPTTIDWKAAATAVRANNDAVRPVTIDISRFAHLIKPGKNVLAIHGMNRSATNNDALWVPQLNAGYMKSVPPVNVNVSQPQATFSGLGWVNIRHIRLKGQTEPLDVRWITPTRWQTTLPVRQGVNEFVLEAIDYDGNVVGTQTVKATSTVTNPLLDFLRVGELMYHPSDVTANERTAGISDADDFEFIELVNTNSNLQAPPLDLTGVQIAGGLSYTFPAMSLASGERIVVARNRAAFPLRYGDQVNVVGPYEQGQLSNAGEELQVLDAGGALLMSFVYNDEAGWPVAADGAGASLELIDAAHTPITELGVAARWQASPQRNGTPGRAPSAAIVGDFNGDLVADGTDLELLCRALPSGDIAFDLNRDQQLNRDDVEVMVTQVLHTVMGDANLDGIFDSGDLVSVFAAGLYEDPLAPTATWATGDWDCDGKFTTSDLVAVFAVGSYSAAARPAGVLSPLAVDRLFAQ